MPKKIKPIIKKPSTFWSSGPKKPYWNPKRISPSKYPTFVGVNPMKYPARTKQEWRLIDRKPYGDKDKDKLMNWFDCKPANFGLQGKFHRKPKIGKLYGSEEKLLGKLRGKVNERVEDIIYKDSKEEKELLEKNLKGLNFKSSSPRKRRVKNIKLREQRAAEQIKLKELTPILAKTKLMPEDFPETEEQRIKTKILSPPPISKVVSEYNPIFQEIPPYYDDILKKTKELTALSRVRTKKEIEKALEEGGVKTEKEIEVEKLKNTINEKKKQLQRIEAIHETINIKKRSGKKGRQTMERTKKGRLDEVKNELLKLEFQLDKLKKPISIESNVALVEPIINEKRFIDTSWRKEEIEKAEKDLEEARTKGLFGDKKARVGYSKKKEEPEKKEKEEQKEYEKMMKELEENKKNPVGAIIIPTKIVHLVKGDTPEDWDRRQKIKEESEEMEMAFPGIKGYDAQDFIDTSMKDIKEEKKWEEKQDKEISEKYGPRDYEETERAERQERARESTEKTAQELIDEA